jgi:hypothetical protein
LDLTNIKQKCDIQFYGIMQVSFSEVGTVQEMDPVIWKNQMTVGMTSADVVNLGGIWEGDSSTLPKSTFW